MTLHYLESFNSWDDGDFEQTWWGDSSFEYVYIRNDAGYFWRPGDNVCHNYGTNSYDINRPLWSGEAVEAIIVGYKRLQRNQDTSLLLSVYNLAAQDQFTLQSRQDGSIYAWRGSHVNTFLAVSRPGLLKQRVYQQIEMKVKVHDSTGYWYVRVDGEDVFSGENLDTKYQTIPGIGQIGISGGSVAYEDLYVATVSGEFHNDFIGGLRIDCLQPNAPGYNTDWTPDSGDNWDRVNDGGSVDDDSSYIASSTDGHFDTYMFEDLSVLPNATTIEGVTVKCYSYESVPSGEVIPVFYDGTKYVGSGERAAREWSTAEKLWSGKNYYVKPGWVWERDPGGGAWAAATINSGEFGIELNYP